MILLLAACLESLLEAPFILTAGLPPVHDIAQAPDSNLFVATERGIFYITSDGAAVTQDPLSAQAISSHGSHLYALNGGSLYWTALPLGSAEWKRLPAPEGTHDIQAWCHETVLLAADSGLYRWVPDTGHISLEPWGRPAERIGLMYGAPCDEVITAYQGSVTLHRGADTTVLARELEVIHAITVSADGGVWAVHRASPVLSLLRDGLPEVRARHLGDVRAVQFGGGGIWAPENAYLASGEGRLDYARVR